MQSDLQTARGTMTIPATNSALQSVPQDKRKLAYACGQALASLNLNTKPYELNATKHALRVALEPWPELLAEIEGDVKRTETSLRLTAQPVERDRSIIRKAMGEKPSVN